MMPRLPAHSRRAFALVFLLALLLPADMSAQRDAPQAGQSDRAWPAPSVGIHAGYDQTVRGELLGAQVRIPVLTNRKVELLASGNATFVSGLREYQYDLDAVYVPGGRQGGLYVGGGLSFRNTIFETDVNAPRETRQGYGVVVGLQSSNVAGPFGAQFEFRWVFLPGSLDPRIISLGLNLPLWGRRGGDSR